MTLLAKQKLFVRLVCQLLEHANRTGYEVTFGETYRPPETAKIYAMKGIGAEHSLHTKRIAIDLNLFRDGVYLTRSEDYAGLGRYWEQLSGPDHQCRWGGDWGDGNHFSIALGDQA
jgi:hypothetical protein